MSYPNLKSLKPLSINQELMPAEYARMQYLVDEWENIRTLCAEKMVPIAEQIYFETLRHYTDTRRPLPAVRIAQLYNRRVANILNRANLPLMTMRNLLECLSFSGTIPVVCNMTPRGGILLLPRIVVETYNSRMMQGVPMPDFTKMVQGLADGPELSARGLDQAAHAFETAEDLQPVVPQIVTDDQKIDTEAKPTEGPNFLAGLPDNSRLMTNTSSDQPDTE